MASADPAPRGTIYDLGYQGYDGPRLGRRYAVWSLYTLSLRNAFGFGRGLLPKVLAIGLVVLAFMPAVVQLIIAGVVPVDDFEFVRPEEYYGLIQVIIMLFVAALASDLVGNDRRNGTLALYFSRPIERDDYALAKLAALATALLAITVFPQLVMFAGNWLGAPDGIEWARDNAADVIPIVVSGVLLCAMFGSIGIVIATFAERRAFSIISILAYFLISFTVVGIVISIVEAEVGRMLVLGSPFHVTRGLALFVFDAFPDSRFATQDGDTDVQLAWLGLPGVGYLVATLTYTVFASWVTIRRYRGSV